MLELEAGDMHAHGQRDFVLSYEADFPVTFRKMGNKLMVNATQITMHFGKIPSEWLRITCGVRWPVADKLTVTNFRSLRLVGVARAPHGLNHR